VRAACVLDALDDQIAPDEHGLDLHLRHDAAFAERLREAFHRARACGLLASRGGSERQGWCMASNVQRE
jgi:hypothetical protein